MDQERTDEGAPSFTIAILFHRHLDVLERTLPRSLHTLTDSTGEAFEVVLHCDGTPEEVAVEVLRRREQWRVDEVRFRSRAGFVASGDASNNGHRRLFAERTRYLVAERGVRIWLAGFAAHVVHGLPCAMANAALRMRYI